MKHSDIEQLHVAGLISDEQRRQIIDRFQLKEDGGKFLTILAFLGAVLVISGLVLLISANWEEIPRGVKLALGLVLMLGAHAGGCWLRTGPGNYAKSGEALHVVGSGLFLGNIALVGQIYHLSSRLPNAFLLWWAGIAALPWLLRSKAQHVLALLAFGLWFGLEANERDGWLYFSHGEAQIILYALLGLIYFGAGGWLRRTSFADFAGPTEKLGLLGFHFFAYPMTWGFWFSDPAGMSGRPAWVFLGLSLTALGLLTAGLRTETRLTPQWRWTWGLALAGSIALLAGAVFLNADGRGYNPGLDGAWYHWVASVGLFIFCLLQIQVGVQQRSSFTVNVGVVFIALNLLATYLTLIGSMAHTGMIFLISGIFLIAFGFYLEKKRRALLRRMATSNP